MPFRRPKRGFIPLEDVLLPGDSRSTEAGGKVRNRRGGDAVPRSPEECDEVVAAIRTMEQTERMSVDGAVALLKVTKDLLRACEAASQAYEKYAPRVPVNGPDPDEADGFIRLRALLPTFLARVQEATRDAQSRVNLHYFASPRRDRAPEPKDSPKAEKRSKPATMAIRALRARSGWTDGQIATEEMEHERPGSSVNLVAWRKRSRNVKTFLRRLRER